MEVIEKTYADLDRWQVRVREVEVPQPGSELHADDKVFPHHPVSEAARLSLASAGEHLRLVRTTLGAGELYPSATFTTLRGALVGAAQGVWILAAETPHERQQRGLTVVLESYKQLKTYNRETSSGASLTEEEREQAASQLAWLEERMAQVEALRTTRAALDLTNDVIPKALAATFKDPVLCWQGLLHWRHMGGDAHVLPWAVAQRATFTERPDRSGLSRATSVGSVAQAVGPYYMAYRLLRNGWSLYDRRCEGT